MKVGKGGMTALARSSQFLETVCLRPNFVMGFVCALRVWGGAASERGGIDGHRLGWGNAGHVWLPAVDNLDAANG